MNVRKRNKFDIHYKVLKKTCSKMLSQFCSSIYLTIIIHIKIKFFLNGLMAHNRNNVTYISTSQRLSNKQKIFTFYRYKPFLPRKILPKVRTKKKLTIMENFPTHLHLRSTHIHQSRSATSLIPSAGAPGAKLNSCSLQIEARLSSRVQRQCHARARL